jgi:D-sedoheptulose 7-phosphate isomerase
MRNAHRAILPRASTPSSDAFSERYLDAMGGCLGQISIEEIERFHQELLSAYQRDAQVFLVGNGGSASLCSHLACDLGKTLLGKDPTREQKRFRVLSLCDNLSLLTAWANDVSYDCVFAEQVKAFGRREDLLIAITGSGNSPNILAAVRTAKSMGLRTFGWLGFDGGKARALLDDSILVPVDDYGLVESAHGVLTHLCTAWLRGVREAQP